ncbi:hypothetical protein ACHAQH_004522 [Verticillium albo-atrum]
MDYSKHSSSSRYSTKSTSTGGSGQSNSYSIDRYTNTTNARETFYVNGGYSNGPRERQADLDAFDKNWAKPTGSSRRR